MITKEQIAHDLTIVYLNNRYGIEVEGSIYVTDGDGSGSIYTEKLPELDKIKYVKVKTGEKNFLGFNKTKREENGYVMDDIFSGMISEYFEVYEYLLKKLNER